MSAGENPKEDADGRSAEARAEELMQRVATDASRVISRVAGRVREEFDDILAEARTVHEGWRSPNE